MSGDLSTGYIESMATGMASEEALSMYINTDDGVTINGVSSVTTADVEVDNGIIHAVDAVIGLPDITTFATADTLSGLKSIKITGASADFSVDEKITQTVTGGTAYGTVVSWTLDSGSTTAGVLKYIQTTDAHTDQGVVRAFESNGSNAITGESSTASGNVDTSYASSLLGVTFASGLANPEIENNSGNVIYVENRRLITRAPDQIEDIKLVIEF